MTKCTVIAGITRLKNYSITNLEIKRIIVELLAENYPNVKNMVYVKIAIKKEYKSKGTNTKQVATCEFYS